MRDLSGVPYIGSRISLISKSEIRYEGILYSIDTKESTVALQNVRSFGTEGRKEEAIPASNEVYDYIIFRGADIKDIHVREAPTPTPTPNRPVDPAIISMPSAAPPQGQPLGAPAPAPGSAPAPAPVPGAGPAPAPAPVAGAPTPNQTQGAGSSSASGSSSSTPSQPAQGQNPSQPPMYNAYPPHYPYPYNPMYYPPYYNYPPPPGGAPHPAGPQIPPHPHAHAPHLHHPHAHPHPHHPPSHPPSLIHPHGPPSAPSDPAAPPKPAPTEPASNPSAAPSNPAAPTPATTPSTPAPTPVAPSTVSPSSAITTPLPVSPPALSPSNAPANPTPATQAQPQITSPQNVGKPKDNTTRQDRSNQRNQNQKRYEPVDRKVQQGGRNPQADNVTGDLAQLNINPSLPTPAHPFQHQQKPMHQGGHVGYGGHRGGANHHGRRGGRGGPQAGGLIPFPGQLSHPPPHMQQHPPHMQQHQKKPQEEFNFEMANARFSKEKLMEEVTHVTPEQTKTELPPPAPAPGLSSAYNKTSSFFDNLSCETLERAASKPDENRRGKQSSQDQRRLDTETFGSASMRSLHAHSHGSHRGRRYHSNRGGHSNNRGPQQQQQQQQQKDKAEISVRT